MTTPKEQTIELLLDLSELFDHPRWSELHAQIRTAFDAWLDHEDALAIAADNERRHAEAVIPGPWEPAAEQT